MVDLDNLNADETAFVHEFLDFLLQHGKACCTDFPEVDPDRFEELANAVVAEMNKHVAH